ncbi:MAG TPA: ROK family protein, partial [Stellaceae bacterium]|nr:ROK family protein [Stellaceae bacterium]
MSLGIRLDDVRRRNRAMTIAAVRRAGRPSRTEIVAATNLSHATISAITADLIGEGVLVEAKTPEASLIKRGRPQVGLELSGHAAAAVTLSLSMNSLSSAITDYSGLVLAEERRKLDTLKLSRRALIDECVAMARLRLRDPALAGRRVFRIVLVVQGTTDAGSRRLVWSPITPHGDIPFAAALEQALGVPATVENDCNMMAMALSWRDPERYRDNFAAILLSIGVGMGLVLKGELFTGARSSGGEFGHMIHRPDGALCRCGRRGCIEAYAGDYAIWRNARRKDEGEKPVAEVDPAE